MSPCTMSEKWDDTRWKGEKEGGGDEEEKEEEEEEDEANMYAVCGFGRQSGGGPTHT